MNTSLKINTCKFPNVLFLGNGLLKLSENGISWSELLNCLEKDDHSDIILDGIPYAMQPEALCGSDYEEVQRILAEKIHDCNPHKLMEKLLSFPFDAIITTNYTYEIEAVLSAKKWTEYQRKKSFHVLSSSPHVRYNTFVCNVIQTSDNRTIPIFHIHGERERKHSMILSYYSYAGSLYRLNDYNKKRGNYLQEAQVEGNEIDCQCWLDYFLLGNIYAVGFGFDFSESDVWWAIERKAREHAECGKLTVYTEADKADALSKVTLLKALNADCKCIASNGDYNAYYHTIIDDIRKILSHLDLDFVNF